MTGHQPAPDPLNALRAALERAAGALHAEGPLRGLKLDPPPRAELGDYSTNAAMLLAPRLGQPPRAIAEQLGEALTGLLGGSLDRVEVAGPGFLNLHLADPWYRDALGRVLAAGQDFGAGPRSGRRILIEFVSANPTGPLTAAGGRHAAYGDALARLLELAGDEVEREYYVNDYGTQVANLGASIRARARGEPVPQDGYQGRYVGELADRIEGAAEMDAAELARRGVAEMVESIRATLHRFRVDFDTWYSESSLHEGAPTAVEQALARLDEQNALYEHEGATWLRTSAHGDDKDRVLRRSSGEATYFASDVAYHLHKRARGFDRLIDVLGADHHGYVARMRAAFAALGEDPDVLEILIMQFVNVIERGERASMSKRRGDFVTLDELLDEIGIDAARFFLLQRSHDTTIDLDLDLARAESSENPVYYVQYAHARIASLRGKAGAGRVDGAVGALVDAAAADGPGGGAGDGATVALDPSERALIKALLAFPAEVAEAAERRAPHRIAAYALELAQSFTAFYRDCRVVGAEPREAETFRLALSVAAQRTIARALDVLGVDAPESM